MNKPRKQRPKGRVTSASHNGDGEKELDSAGSLAAGRADHLRIDKLMEQVRQIIAETPEVRPEKVEPLLKAVVSGTYEINPRKLANIIITKLILDS